MKQATYLTQQQLIDNRGWTISAIKKFKLEPDKLVKNRMNRSAPVKLFLLTKVKRKEQGKKWQEWKLSKDKRSISIQVSIGERKDEMVKLADSLSIKLPDWSLDRARKAAIESFNVFKSYKGDYESYASKNSDIAFLNRITVNFIRHELTQYDKALAESYGQVGVGEFHDRLKERILELIGTKYTELYDECQVQQCRG